MALTENGQNIYNSITNLLDSVEVDKDVVVEEGWIWDTKSSKLGDRIDAAIKRIAEINEESNPTTEQIEQRDQLANAVALAETQLAVLSDSEALLVLGGDGSGNDLTADQSAAAATSRQNAKKVQDAQKSNRLQSIGSPDASEEVDTEDVQIVRTAYQCFLLYNTDFFSEYHKKNLLSTPTSTGGYQPIAGDIIKTSGYVKKDNTSEPRIYLLSGDEDTAVANNKFNLCPGNEAFAKIKNHEIAQLSPLLRIFKTYRNYQGSGKDRKIEFEFRNRTGLEGLVVPVITEQPVGPPTWQFSKGSEIGVKSFNWRLLGTDPFTATRDIEATLVLHMQHFSTLAQTRYDRKTNTPYKYLDLILQPNCTKRTDPTTPQPYDGYYNPACYEIQVDVGYAPQQGSGLEDAICCQYDKLYLVHVDHKFDFKEDGTMDLTISYRGRLEAIMNDKKFNTLLPGGGFIKPSNTQTSGDLLDIYFNIEYDLEQERKKPSPNEATIKELERKREAVLSDLRQFTYAMNLEMLEDHQMIHSIDLSQDDFLRFARWKEAKFGGTLPDKLSLANLNKISTGVENNVAIALQSATEAASADPEADAVGETTKKIEELTEAQVAQRLSAAVEKETHTINFIYLGDLIAMVLSNTLGEVDIPISINQNTQGLFFTSQTTQEANKTKVGTSVRVTDPITDNFHIVLGNLDITEGNGSQKYVNLAHIPISLESYQDFMLKNVISQNTDHYSLTDFLDDIIGDLVTDMFSNQCFGGLLEADSRVSISRVTGNTRLGGAKVFAKKSNAYKEIQTANINSTNLPFGKDSRCIDRASDPYDYLLINTLNTHPKGLAGTRDSGVRGDNIGDRERGILHFTYGEDRGLLKSVQFSKTDQEYLPEARFAGGDGSILNQLSNVYDATFNMIGNNIFKPGMLIYFNPDPIGAGSPWQYSKDAKGNMTQRSWSNIMGIGGYHLVTETDHSIAPGEFNTSVKARWVTSGEDRTSAARPVEPPSPSPSPVLGPEPPPPSPVLGPEPPPASPPVIPLDPTPIIGLRGGTRRGPFASTENPEGSPSEDVS